MMTGPGILLLHRETDLMKKNQAIRRETMMIVRGTPRHQEVTRERKGPAILHHPVTMIQEGVTTDLAILLHLRATIHHPRAEVLLLQAGKILHPDLREATLQALGQEDNRREILRDEFISKYN